MKQQKIPQVTIHFLRIIPLLDGVDRVDKPAAIVFRRIESIVLDVAETADLAEMADFEGWFRKM